MGIWDIALVPISKKIVFHTSMMTIPSEEQDEYQCTIPLSLDYINLQVRRIFL